MKRGRPAQPLEARIYAKIEGWPRSADECWIWKPKHQAFDGTTVLRLLYAIRYGETLHDSCRPHNVCGFRKCVNPQHNPLRPHNPDRYGGMILPKALREAMPITDEEEIEECMRLIETFDPASPEALREHQLAQDPPTDWALHHIQEAWRRLKR